MSIVKQGSGAGKTRADIWAGTMEPTVWRVGPDPSRDRLSSRAIPDAPTDPESLPDVCAKGIAMPFSHHTDMLLPHDHQDGTNREGLLPINWLSGTSHEDYQEHYRPLMRIHALTYDREAREQAEEVGLAVGATRAYGAGNRAYGELPDPERTCFERDRDRIVHSPAFRRLAGKTQVFVFPKDHQRTRLTHALEVAQVATAIARAAGLNVALTEAIALGHDCGHGPGGHACEDALSIFLENGFDHAPWGANVTLSSLNLCHETLDGIRNHSWSRPLPATPEGMVVRWADRCAYCAHDLEDAVRSGITSTDQLPASVSETIGTTRSRQLDTLIRAVVQCIRDNGVIGMSPELAHALAELRRFNYENIYTREDSIRQGDAVVAVLRSLVEYFIDHPDRLPVDRQELQYRHHTTSTLPAPPSATTYDSATSIHWTSVAYVAGMTDRFAFDLAVDCLGWDPAKLPVGIG